MTEPDTDTMFWRRVAARYLHQLTDARRRLREAEAERDRLREQLDSGSQADSS